ncbi:MAG: hypothetical protein HYZ75_19900 [Elusimicrobia bacterium]|nr:hypothetical protein [Elusimicrobiota bacterium]
MKETERDSFFNDIRRSANGNMDRVAKTVGVPVNILQDWVNGATNVPYIALQRLASEFSVELPTVTELRREFQQMTQAVAPKRPAVRMPSHPGPVGGAGRGEAGRGEPRARRDGPRVSGGNDYEPLRPEAPVRRERPARPERGSRRRGEKKDRPAKQGQPKQERKQPQKGQRQPARPSRAPLPSGPRVPKLSAEAAYWAGAVSAAGRRDGDILVLSADRRLGQNYAAIWSSRTFELFGVRPDLSFTADELCQEARLPLAGLEDFVGRMDLKPEAARPPAPRWVWSNPDWKKSFLKGLVDASAEFIREPEVVMNLAPLGEPLRRSAEKLFASVGLAPRVNEDGTLSLAGAETVEKYHTAVGADNMKLRDQLKAFFGRAGASEAPVAPMPPVAPLPETTTAEGTQAQTSADKAQERGRGRRRRGRRGGRGRRAAQAPAQPGQAAQGAPADSPAPEPHQPTEGQPPEV